MHSSKKPDLALLASVLVAEGTPYVIVGGIALQVHQREPRTTLDIDVAVRDRTKLPRAALSKAGFKETGSHKHSVNFVGPGQTPVQFTDDPTLAKGIEQAVEVPLDDLVLKVLCVEDLLVAKLRAGRDPARRRSKRLQDLADVHALIEQDPALDTCLSADDKALLAGLLI